MGMKNSFFKKHTSPQKLRKSHRKFHSRGSVVNVWNTIQPTHWLQAMHRGANTTATLPIPETFHGISFALFYGFSSFLQPLFLFQICRTP